MLVVLFVVVLLTLGWTLLTGLMRKPSRRMTMETLLKPLKEKP